MRSKKDEAIIQLKLKGYRAEDNKIISPRGIQLSTTLDDKGYLSFNARVKGIGNIKLRLHRFIAYCKYGDIIFNPDLQVRHLDSNCLNNSFDNLALGTCSENQMDKSKVVRMNSAIHATSFKKIYDHEAIIKRKNEGASYTVIMKEFNIPNKSTVSFIVNKSLAAA